MTTASSAVVPEPVSVTPELLAQHSITADEYDRILAALGRIPSLTELGIYSVMWSEHCSYKSSRVHLKRLPTKSDRVVQGPGENAGIIDVGDGWACAFKIESHNHPSYIEPLPGRGHRRGRHFARHLHHGRAAAGGHGLAALRADSKPSESAEREAVAQKPLHRGGRGERHRRLRQLLWRAQPGRRNKIRGLLQRQPAGECFCAGPGSQG